MPAVAKVNKNEELVFFAHSAYPRTFRYNFTLNPLFTPFAITLDQVDAVTILDACHVGFATRDATQIGRAAEVVSAVREDQKAFPKQNRVIFTSRLASEIALRRGQAHASISFPEVIVELQRTAHPNRFPSFEMLTLTIPIRVNLLPSSSALVHKPPTHLK